MQTLPELKSFIEEHFEGCSEEDFFTFFNNKDLVEKIVDELEGFVPDYEISEVDVNWARISSELNLKIVVVTCCGEILEISEFKYECPLVFTILQCNTEKGLRSYLVYKNESSHVCLQPRVENNEESQLKRLALRLTRLVVPMGVDEILKSKILGQVQTLEQLQKRGWGISKELLQIPVKIIEVAPEKPLETIFKQQLEENKVPKSIGPQYPVEKSVNIKNNTPTGKVLPVTMPPISVHDRNPGNLPLNRSTILDSKSNFPEISSVNKPKEKKYIPPAKFVDPTPISSSLFDKGKSQPNPHCQNCQQYPCDVITWPCNCLLSFDCIQYSFMEKKCISCLLDLNEEFLEMIKIYLN